VVRVSDDSGELVESLPDVFNGRWRFGNNTDGGVIGELSGLWRADVTPLLYSIGQSQSLNVYGADGTVIPLDFDEPFSLASVPEPSSIAISSVIGLGLAFGWYRRCRRC